MGKPSVAMVETGEERERVAGGRRPPQGNCPTPPRPLVVSRPVIPGVTHARAHRAPATSFSIPLAAVLTPYINIDARLISPYSSRLASLALDFARISLPPLGRSGLVILDRGVLSRVAHWHIYEVARGRSSDFADEEATSVLCARTIVCISRPVIGNADPSASAINVAMQFPIPDESTALLARGTVPRLHQGRAAQAPSADFTRYWRHERRLHNKETDIPGRARKQTSQMAASFSGPRACRRSNPPSIGVDAADDAISANCFEQHELSFAAGGRRFATQRPRAGGPLPAAARRRTDRQVGSPATDVPESEQVCAGVRVRHASPTSPGMKYPRGWCGLGHRPPPAYRHDLSTGARRVYGSPLDHARARMPRVMIVQDTADDTGSGRTGRRGKRQRNAYIGRRISNMGTLTTTRRRAISHRPLALALELDGSGPAAYRSSRAPTPLLLKRRGARMPVHTTPPHPNTKCTQLDAPRPPIRARTLDGVAIAGAADTQGARPRARATQNARPVEAPRRDAHNEMIRGADVLLTAAANPFKGPFSSRKAQPAANRVEPGPRANHPDAYECGMPMSVPVSTIHVHTHTRNIQRVPQPVPRGAGPESPAGACPAEDQTAGVAAAFPFISSGLEARRNGVCV
ncbi:hypothetical protein HETIRDRAFT_452378 [Heterobasidion irregulare TC 32-1]|uniref:Uncharacterized protein n=1 Tax=Heterobasidion irregulare (strain TC 32-1) TaxID=747525 RepID=W4K6C7_HETIT|nr:uncharacterized protein HETIRDRAFT_452378 [Heterobasidion irregulare TC 32-1]ETW80900.1 hypothetical protein HETIRDRAFT_452378 [Heterobasidion irregulare TC 32-1]